MLAPLFFSCPAVCAVPISVGLLDELRWPWASRLAKIEPCLRCPYGQVHFHANMDSPAAAGEPIAI